MHTLADLIGALQKEVALTPIRNIRTLNMIGLQVALEAKEMIGHERFLWPRLKDSTIEIKQRLGQGLNFRPESPLYATGRYRDDINFMVEGPAVAVGTDLEYVQYLENGTAHMAPRPLFKPALLAAAVKFMPNVPDGYLKTFK
jgi:hypothetical protein